MRQFIRILAIIFTIVVLIGVTYFLVKYNTDYVANHPLPSGEEQVKINETKEKVEVTLESKEAIEKYAKEEKASLISSIKNTIKMNIGATVRKSINTNITKANYNEVAFIVSSENASGNSLSGEDKIEIPDSIPCTIQIAGSMAYIIPNDRKLDSFEFHYRGDNKLVAYVREYAGTAVKASYYFENGELLEREVNDQDSKYNVFEDDGLILQRAEELYKLYFTEN